MNRSTPCKPELGGDWRTVDDYMPTLKYGTQLPPATPSTELIKVGSGPAGGNVKIIDIDVPFASILKTAFKILGAWLIVGVCVAPVAIIIWIVIVASIANFLGHVFSGSHL